MSNAAAVVGYGMGFWIVAVGLDGIPFRRWTRRNAAAVVAVLLVGLLIGLWMPAAMPWIVAIQVGVAPGAIVGVVFTRLVDK